MADLERTIAVLFQGEDQLSPMMKSLSSKISDFGNKIEDIADPFSKITDGVLKLDAVLAALAAGGLAYAFKKSAEFEASSVTLSRILGAEVDQIGKVEVAATDMSNAYGMASVSILNSVTDFRRAGFAINDSLGLTEAGIRLVIAAGEAEFGVAESTGTIISVLKGFKAPASEAVRLTDILNRVADEYATNVSQLALGMSQLAPIASRMGFSFEETAGMLTPVIEVFRSGEESAVALKMGLISLVNDSAPVAKALAMLGVEQKNANGTLRNGRDIMYDVAKAFQTADKDIKLFVMSELVGIRQAARMSEVFDNLGKVIDVTNTALGASGSISLEVARQLTTAKTAVDRFVSGFDNLAIAVGKQFRDAAANAIRGGVAIEIALQNLVNAGAFAPVLKEVENFANQIGETFFKIAEMAPEIFAKVNFKPLIDAVHNVADSIGMLFGDFDFKSADGVAEVINRIIRFLATLGNVTAGIVDAFKPVIESILNFTDEMGNMDVKTQEAIGNILGAAKIITQFGIEVAAVIVALGDDTKAMGFVFQTVVNLITGTFSLTLNVWRSLKLAFLDIVDDLLQVSGWLAENLGGQALGKLFGVDFSASVAENRKVIGEWKKGVEQDLREGADYAIGRLTGIQTSFGEVGGSADKAGSKVNKFSDDVRKIPGSKSTTVSATVKSADLSDFWKRINSLPAEKKVKLSSEAKAEDLIKFGNDLAKIPEQKRVEINTLLEQGDFNEARKLLDEIPAELKTEVSIEADRTTAAATQNILKVTEKSVSDIGAAADTATDKINNLGDSVEKITRARADRSLVSGLLGIADIAAKQLDSGPIWDVLGVNFSKSLDENKNAIAEWIRDTQNDIRTGADFIIEKLTGIKTNFGSLNYSMEELGKGVGFEWADELSKKLNEIPEEKKISVLADIKTEDLFKLGVDLAKIPAEKRIDVQTLLDAGKFTEAKKLLDSIPPEVKVNVQAYIDKDGDLLKFNNDLAGIPEEKSVKIQALLDEGKIEDARKMIEETVKERHIKFQADTKDAKTQWNELKVYLDDGKEKIIKVQADPESIKEVKTEIKKELGPLEVLKIQTEVDIKKLEAATSVINTATEWKAKLDISEVEAKAEVLKSMFESIGETVAAAASASADMFGDLSSALTKDLHWSDSDKMYDILDRQMDIEEKLAEEQLKLLESRRKAFERGDAAIKVSMDGAAPEIEAFLWSFMERIQVRVNELGGAYLMGIQEAAQ